MGILVGLVVTIVIISAVVGVIANVVNKMNEAKAPPPRRPAPLRPDAPDGTRSSGKDMDRFLAEIDRLRRRNAEAGGTPAQPSAQAPPRSAQRSVRNPSTVPVAKPAASRAADRTRPDRPKGRPVAELADTPPAAPARRSEPLPVAAPVLPTLPRLRSTTPRVEDLPVAALVVPTTVPGSRDGRLPQRARPAAKTELGRNLTNLLASGDGVAMAVILQEILGPPKSKK